MRLSTRSFKLSLVIPTTLEHTTGPQSRRNIKHFNRSYLIPTTLQSFSYHHNLASSSKLTLDHLKCLETVSDSTSSKSSTSISIRPHSHTHNKLHNTLDELYDHLASTKPIHHHPNPIRLSSSLEENKQETVIKPHRNQLDCLVDHALDTGHLHPHQFQRLLISSSINQTIPIENYDHRQLRALICGSIILNDHKTARYWIDRLPNDQLEIYPDLFRACGWARRGVGMMRRVVSALLRSNQRHGEQATRIIERYIEILIQWGNLHRAWNLLTGFDLGPTIELSKQAQLIGGRFSEQVSKLRPISDQNRVWRPSESAYSSLISIYLLNDRPDLAITLGSLQPHINRFDRCHALLLSARALITPDNQASFDWHTLSGSTPSPFKPWTTAILAKLIYRYRGLDELERFITQRRSSSPSLDRTLINSLLEILINQPNNRISPAHLADWSHRLKHHGLLGERELEKFLRFTRQWIESQLVTRIRQQLVVRPEKRVTKPALQFDVKDKRLGYSQLKNLVRSVYEDCDGCNPSTTVISELTRIEAMIGSPTEKLEQLIDCSVRESDMMVRSSHMIGLIWSQLICYDLKGLVQLVEIELKSKYKLMLTGVLISLILGGLIAMRVPKLVMLNISQRLIDQRELRLSIKGPLEEVQRTHSPESYMNAVKAAVSAGDLWLVKELHEEMIDRFGHVRLYNEEFGGDYLALIIECLMRLNEPLKAQLEAKEGVERIQDLIRSEKTLNQRKFLHSDDRFKLIEEVPTDLFKSSCYSKKLMKAIIRSNKNIQRKISKLERLLKQEYGNDNNNEEEEQPHLKRYDDEMTNKKKQEILTRLLELKKANEISKELIELSEIKKNKKNENKSSQGLSDFNELIEHDRWERIFNRFGGID